MTINWATIRDEVPSDPKNTEDYFDWTPEGKAFRVLIEYGRPMSVNEIADVVGYGSTTTLLHAAIRRRIDLFEEIELDKYQRFQLVEKFRQ